MRAVTKCNIGTSASSSSEYNLEALLEDHEEEQTAIDNLHTCGEDEAEE